MTLDEQLAEYNEIKNLLKTALTGNLSTGALIGYTTNGTKLVYESVVKTNELLREYNSLISTAEANIKLQSIRGY